VADDIVEQLAYFVTNEARMPAGLTVTVIEEIERLREQVDQSTASLSLNVTVLMNQVAENGRLRAMIKEYVAAETASWPPDDMETYARWEQRAGDAWDILVEEARRD
jgi:hypothetical protein